MATLGKYELLEEAGRGGFAVVYKAHDPDLDRDVAVKILLPHRSWNPAFAERFRNEAQAMARLRHPNIVIVHEVGEDDEQLYIAMEFLRGRTLAQVLEDEQAMQVPKVLNILEQVAGALDYAHAEGALHRDVKPSNIMVEQTRQGQLRAILMDFGLVKVMASEESITSTGTILGSPAYMAPEQADFERKDEIGPATDVYALGIVAYEMLTGQVPFSGSTAATLVAHVLKAPPDPLTIRDDLPPAVSEVLLKALAKDGQDRYPSAGEMVQALRESIEAGEKEQQREAQLAGLYGQIQAAIEAGDWDTAEARSREILALEPGYRDMPEVWIKVSNGKARHVELEGLYGTAEAALERGAWAEAKELCRQIQAQEPGYRDVDQLLARAEEALRQEQEKEERQAQLTALYWQAQQAEKQAQWPEVVRLGSEIESLQPGYRDVAGLLEKARTEMSQAEAQEAQKARLVTLYSRAQAASRAKDWAEAQRLCAEIESLEPGYKRVGQLRVKADKALAKQAAAKKPAPPEPQPEPVEEQPAPTPTKKRRRIRGRVLVVIGGIAVCLVVMCLAGLVINNAQQEKARATSVARSRATREAKAEATEAAESTATAHAQATAEALLAVPSGWTAQIQETFEDNALQWQDGEVEDELATQSLAIGDGVYQVTVVAPNGVHVRQMPVLQAAVSDFHLTVEARQVDGPTTVRYGLVFRDQGNSFYTFLVQEIGWFAVLSLVGGEWVMGPVGLTETAAILPGQTNRLTVVGKGPHLTFFINDQLVAEVEDSALTLGKVGMAINLSEEGSAVFEFDNFELYTP